MADDFYKESRIIRIDLGSGRDSFLDDIKQFYGIKRYPYHHDRTKVLSPGQVTLYHLSLQGCKGFENCILRYYMRNDDLFSIAVSKSEDSGQTFSTPMEMFGKKAQPDYMRRVISGSQSIGFKFMYKQKNWEAYDGLNYEKVIYAFKRIAAWIDVVSELNPSQIEKLAFNTHLLIIVISESARNLLVAEAFDKILNHQFVIGSMRSELAEPHIWKWKVYTGVSRLHRSREALSAEGILKFKSRDMMVFNEDTSDITFRIVCEMIITMKCLSPGDFTGMGIVKFAYFNKEIPKRAGV